MNWWKPALGGLLAAGSLVPILARRTPGRKQDARPVTRARLTKLLLKAAHLSPDSEAVQWMSAHCTAQPLVWGDLAAHWLRKEGWLHSALCTGLLLPEDRSAGQFCPDAPPAPLGRGPHGGPSLGAGVSRCPGGDLFSGLFRSGTVSRRHGGVRPDSCSDGDSPRPHRRPLPSPCPPLPDGGGGNGPSSPEDHGRRGHPPLPLPPPPL